MHPLLSGIRLVVFDLDGTLVDSVPDLSAAVDEALRELGYPAVGEASVRDWVGNGSLKLMERALADALGELPPAVLLTRGHEAFLDRYGRDPSSRTLLYPGVREGLDGLRERGMSLALVTNKPYAFIAPILDSMGLTDYFGLCLGGDSLPE